MTIKKAYIELHALLTANEDKKVKSILPEAIELMSAKGAGGAASSVHKDADGNVVAVLDYYFKKWLPVSLVEFGKKANSASGLNTMCKLGTSLWTKQQREFKNGKEALLVDVQNGEVQPTEIQAKLDELETARGFIAEFPIPAIAFDSIEEFDAMPYEEMEAAVAAYTEEQERIAAEAAAQESEE